MYMYVEMDSKRSSLNSSLGRTGKTPLSPTDSLSSIGQFRPSLVWLFNHIRRDDREFLTKEDIRQVIGASVDSVQLDAAFQHLDVDNDGEISKDAFIAGFATFLKEAPNSPSPHPAQKRVLMEDCYETSSQKMNGCGREDFQQSLVQLSSHNRYTIESLWSSLSETNPELLGDFEGFVAEIATEVEGAQRALDKQRMATKQEAIQLDEEIESRLNDAKTTLQIQTAYVREQARVRTEEHLVEKEMELFAVRQKLQELWDKLEDCYRFTLQLETEMIHGKQAHNALEQQYFELRKEKEELKEKLEISEERLQGKFGTQRSRVRRGRKLRQRKKAEDRSGSEGELLRGDSEGDLLRGDSEGELLRGDSEGDLLRGDSEGELLRGDSEGDLLRGGSEGELLRGDSEGDLLRGDSEGELLRGGSEGDLLRGGSEGELLRGGSEGDLLRDDLDNELLSESELLRSGFEVLGSESDLLGSEYDLLRSSHEKELLKLKRNYEQEIAELRKKLASLQHEVSSSETDDEVARINQHRESHHSLMDEILQQEGPASPVLRGEPLLSGAGGLPNRTISLPNLHQGVRQTSERISPMPRYVPVYVNSHRFVEPPLPPTLPEDRVVPPKDHVSTATQVQTALEEMPLGEDPLSDTLTGEDPYDGRCEVHTRHLLLFDGARFRHY